MLADPLAVMTLQMDVIESQYTQLGEALSKAQDFKEAQRAHEGFLTALMDTSLLDMPIFVSYLTCGLRHPHTSWCPWCGKSDRLIFAPFSVVLTAVAVAQLVVIRHLMKTTKELHLYVYREVVRKEPSTEVCPSLGVKGGWLAASRSACPSVLFWVWIVRSSP